MPKGGKRKGAGRPPTNGTVRKIVGWRLPVHLLTRVYTLAEFEGVTVTAWIERAIIEALTSRLSTTTSTT